MAVARVLLVEDEPFARAMLVSTLEASGITVAAACSSASESLDAARRTSFEVALLDLDLGPGPSGIDIAYALRERNRELGIVFLTSFTDPRIRDSGERPLPRGSRYLVKSRLGQAETLRDAVLDARRDPLRATEAPVREAELTPNQLEVLRLVAAGRSNAEIAHEQGVGEKAIERTVQRILEALGIERGAGNPRVLAARAYGELAGKSLPSPP